jgi:hypothetical protein
MNAKVRKWLMWLGLVIVAIGGLIAYAIQPETLRWKEEVLLHDGQMIIVERSVTFGGPREIGQPPSPSRWGIKFTTPRSGSSSISFESEGGAPPMLLDFEKDVPYITIYLQTGGVRYKYRCPNPPYVFYRYAKSNWEVIPLAEIPQSIFAANLSPDTKELDQRARKGGTITQQEMTEFIGNRHLPESVKRIVRPHGNQTVYGQYGCPERG